VVFNIKYSIPCIKSIYNIKLISKSIYKRTLKWRIVVMAITKHFKSFIYNHSYTSKIKNEVREMTINEHNNNSGNCLLVSLDFFCSLMSWVELSRLTMLVKHLDCQGITFIWLYIFNKWGKSHPLNIRPYTTTIGNQPQCTSYCIVYIFESKS
jgi:hypothetical protein